MFKRVSDAHPTKEIKVAENTAVTINLFTICTKPPVNNKKRIAYQYANYLLQSSTFAQKDQMKNKGAVEISIVPMQDIGITGKYIQNHYDKNVIPLQNGIEMCCRCLLI